jgi:putative endonuclease
VGQTDQGGACSVVPSSENGRYEQRPWFVYLLECRGGRIYTGVSPDFGRRISDHRAGKGAAFTRINPPERLLAVKQFSDKREAMRVEAQVKRLQRP